MAIGSREIQDYDHHLEKQGMWSIAHLGKRRGVWERSHAIPSTAYSILHIKTDTGCCVYDSVILYDHIYIYLVDHPQFFYQTQRWQRIFRRNVWTPLQQSM